MVSNQNRNGWGGARVKVRVKVRVGYLHCPISLPTQGTRPPLQSVSMSVSHGVSHCQTHSGSGLGLGSFAIRRTGPVSFFFRRVVRVRVSCIVATGIRRLGLGLSHEGRQCRLQSARRVVRQGGGCKKSSSRLRRNCGSAEGQGQGEQEHIC